MNMMRGAKSIYGRCTCALCRLMINSCKIMQDSKSHAITQTIHTNLVGLFCDAGQGSAQSKNFTKHLNRSKVQLRNTPNEAASHAALQPTECLRKKAANRGRLHA